MTEEHMREAPTSGKVYKERSDRRNQLQPKPTAGFVSEGLDFDVDYDEDSVVISSGFAKIRAENYIYHVFPDRTEPIQLHTEAASRGTNYVYLIVNRSGEEIRYVIATADRSDPQYPSDVGVKIGEIDLHYEIERLTNRAGDEGVSPPARRFESVDRIVQPRLSLAGRVQNERFLLDAHDVKIQNGVGYVAAKDSTTGDGGFCIVDLSAPSDPSLLGGIDTFDNAQVVLPWKHYCYVGDDDGFHVVDVSDPTSPELLRSAPSPVDGEMNGLDTWSSYVLVASKRAGVLVYDISTPAEPELWGQFDTETTGGLDRPHDAVFFNGRLAVPNARLADTPDVALYEPIDTATNTIKSLSEWTLASVVDEPGLRGSNRIVTSGRYIFVCCHHDHAIGVIDGADPSAPTLETTVDTEDREPDGLCIADSYLLVGANSTVEVFDISTPTDPVPIESYTNTDVFHGTAGAHDLELYGDVVAVTSGGGGHQVDDKLVLLEFGEARFPGLRSGSGRFSNLYVEEQATVRHLRVDTLDSIGGPVQSTDFYLKDDFRAAGSLTDRSGQVTGNYPTVHDGLVTGRYRPAWQSNTDSAAIAGHLVLPSGDSSPTTVYRNSVLTTGSWKFRFRFESITSEQPSTFVFSPFRGPQRKGWHIEINGNGDLDLVKTDSGGDETLISSSWAQDTNEHVVELVRENDGTWELEYDGNDQNSVTDPFLPSEEAVILFGNHTLDSVFIDSLVVE